MRIFMSEIPEVLKKLGASFKNICAEIAELERNRADHEERLESLENYWRHEQNATADLKSAARKIDVLQADKQIKH